MTGRRKWISGGLSAVMLMLAAAVGLPFYYIVVNTVKTPQETGAAPLGLPSHLYLDNYVTVFQSIPILQSFLNTLYLTVVSVLLMLLVGSMAAYGMIMRQTWINRTFGAALVLAFMVPFQSTLIPLYQMLARVHLVDSLNGLVVMYSAGSIFCYFLILGYMKTVPFEIVEAARIDGCGTFGIYWRIILPLIRPILITVAVFQTMWVWNDFITPTVFLSSASNKTLVLQVYSAVGQFSVNWPAFMTLTVIVLFPVVVFFVAMQKHIVDGLVSGGIKG
ncbi:carbohydrate ABC transporter permease [Rhizobium sp. SSA_523]|uniref:carbohydrate ABC transporter permease n=1 Tax=Rhizobium sp. SSA_523 TaxID=2952477 RepID=UPI002090DE19|nr:carbohydrate ABC transporter permease [Rhizobium sp. SSA_523]MCO5733425.1 carbohydrate ABC transporter permease [Rhizobium sp. SSA_523]WKC21603.1 carbohydrate ABC transporter permease [Rhizobium sp. SSA_523]